MCQWFVGSNPTRGAHTFIEVIMKTFNVSLQWKIVKALTRGFSEETLTKKRLVEISPNKKFYTQFSLPWEHSYVPRLLTPSPEFHREAKKFLKSKFNIKLKQNNFLYNLYIKEWKREVSLTIDIRIFPPGIMALTLKLLEFELPLPMESHKLIEYQQLSQVGLLNELTKWLIDLIQPDDKTALPTTFIYKPLMSLSGMCHLDEFEQHFEDNKLEYIGILIRNTKFTSMDERIPSRILDKNREINLKTSKEKLLIDKQGILHLAPAEINRLYHSKSLVHDLLEVSLVIEEFLANYHAFRYLQADYSDYLLYKLMPWIDTPDVIFRKSVSNREIWKLLTNELSLKSIKDHAIDEHLRKAVEEKGSLFRIFNDFKWWEESNFPDLLSGKIRESKGIKIINKDLEQIISHDFDEAKRCLQVKSYKAVVLLCGAIVEAILTSVLDDKKMICLPEADYRTFLSKYPHARRVLEPIKLFLDNNTLPTKYPALNRAIATFISGKVYIDIDTLTGEQTTELDSIAHSELMRNYQKLIPTEHLYKMVLANLTDLVNIFSLIKDDNLFHYINPLRNFRNAIHPGVQIRKTISLDHSKASIAIETVNLLLKYFNVI